MGLWVDAEVIRLTAIRADALGRGGTPGPEASILKLATGQLPQHVYEFCSDLQGADGLLISDYAMDQPDLMGVGNMGDGSEDLDLTKALLNSRSATIGGGTTEIQRNTIGERVLGLPKEPSPPPGLVEELSGEIGR
jgi:alkylation response protein AidB-like acyl-CoA dehydrogenase